MPELTQTEQVRIRQLLSLPEPAWQLAMRNALGSPIDNWDSTGDPDPEWQAVMESAAHGVREGTGPDPLAAGGDYGDPGIEADILAGLAMQMTAEGDYAGAQAVLDGSDPRESARIDLSNATSEYQRAVDLSFATEATRRARDARPLPRTTEERLATAYQRISDGTYVPATLDFAGDGSAAGRALAMQRWAGNPATLTSLPNCGSSDDFGYCVEQHHSLGCGSLRTTGQEADGAMRAAMRRLAAAPVFDAAGRPWADQSGRAMSWSDMFESQTGTAMRDSLFETGDAPRREGSRAAASTGVGDPDDPDAMPGAVPASTAATVQAIRAQVGDELADPAAERVMSRLAAIGRIDAARGRRSASREQQWDVSSRRQQISAAHPSGPPELFSEPVLGSLPAYRQGQP